jgi:hypothetical protein
MAVAQLNFDLPDVGADDGTWGAELNQILGLFKDGFNQLAGLVNSTAVSGIVFYDPTTGWPSSTPTTSPYIFVSAAYPAAPAPTKGSDQSVWIYGIAA